MKPKKKSNVVCTTLLFLLVSVQSLAFSNWAVNDTIIIDGETIYIERDTIGNMDSLENAAKEDVKKKPVSVQRFGVAIHAGYNATVASFGTSLNNVVPLNQFADDDISIGMTPAAALDLSYRFWQFPAKTGMMNLEVHSGIGFNQVRIISDGLDPDSLDRDSLIQLSYQDNELHLIYFDVFEGQEPFGELDTAIFEVLKNKLTYSTLDIPIKVRLTYQPNKSPSSFYFEAGVMKRIILGNPDIGSDNYLVNNKGELVILKASEFKPKQLLRPVFAIGAERRLQPESDGKSSFFSLGFHLNLMVPSTAANTGSLFYVDISSVSLAAFLRYNF